MRQNQGHSQGTHSIVVLGMHRSGTSALAGALIRQGGHAGKEDELVPATDANPRGHSERVDVVERNEALLNEMCHSQYPDMRHCDAFLHPEDLDGCAWVFAAWLEAMTEPGTGADSPTEVERCVRGLSTACPENQPLVLKDPRFSFTFPFWRPALTAPRAIIMLRNPSDVAASLFRRDGIDPDLGFHLWYRYTTSALRVTEGVPRMVVDYDRLIGDPHTTLSQVLRFLERQSTPGLGGTIEHAAATLEPGLRHSGDISCFIPSPAISALYDRLRSCPESDGQETVPLPRDQVDHIGHWSRAIYVARLIQLRNSRDTLGVMVQNGEVAVERINRHPVAGPVLELLRFMKRDPHFGRIQGQKLPGVQREHSATT